MTATILLTKLAFLGGGGEAGRLMRAFDWSRSPLGPPEAWPPTLKTAVALMLQSKQPVYIGWGPDQISLYNDGYIPICGDKHPAGFGQPAAELWAEIWDALGPLNATVMAGEAQFFEDRPFALAGRGTDEPSYFTFSYTPLRDEMATIRGIFCSAIETTDKVVAEQRLAGEADRWARIFEQAPSFICTLRGPEHVFDFVNAAHRRLFGSAAWVGRTVRDAFPDLAGQGFYEALDQVYATGERMVFTDQPVRFRQPETGEEGLRYLDFIYAPLNDADGAISGVFCEGFDVTDRKEADERLRLMINELNHRVKNSLATVQAIAAQTLRRDDVPASVREALLDRLLALSKAHDVLTDESWSGASLHEMAQQAAEPYDVTGARSRFDIHGPPVNLPPKRAIAMALAFHELATNAAKYGALSAPGGRVQIGWTTVEGPDGPRLNLSWTESGGPPVKPPRHTGFGTRLIQRGLASELHGTIEVDYRETGVVCAIDADLGEESDATHLAYPPS